MKDILINDTWALGHKIAEGGYGAVYTATDIQTGGEFAVKIMDLIRHEPARPGSLNLEAAALRGVAGRTRGGKRRIPRAHWHGEESSYYALTTDLLGPSVVDLLGYCGGRFSLKTVLLVGDQAIARVQTIHAAGWLHRDIKPENLLMGLGRQGNTVYAIDMGLSKTWEAARAVFENPPVGGVAQHGTDIYASLDNHRRVECSYKDDLEVLLHTLIYLRMGRLPWSSDPGVALTFMEYGDKKMATTAADTCAGCPPEFQTFLEHVRGLGFYSRPDYAYLRGLLRRAFAREGYRHDNVFDWTEKLFYETYPELRPPPPLPPTPDADNVADEVSQAQGGSAVGGGS